MLDVFDSKQVHQLTSSEMKVITEAVTSMVSFMPRRQPRAVKKKGQQLRSKKDKDNNTRKR
jgi:hypothetical protein